MVVRSKYSHFHYIHASMHALRWISESLHALNPVINTGKSGAVIEVKDVNDLDSILNDSKNKGKLIVIDFTGR